MTLPKISGLILLIIGLAIIIWTLYSSYNIFTGKTDMPEIFESDMQQASSSVQSGQNTQAQIEKMISEQIKGLIPVDVISKILNLAVWSMLAFILIFGGTQIANLGIKLLNKG